MSYRPSSSWRPQSREEWIATALVLAAGVVALAGLVMIAPLGLALLERGAARNLIVASSLLVLASSMLFNAANPAPEQRLSPRAYRRFAAFFLLVGVVVLAIALFF